MGSCIICGTSVEGRICDLHQQDVVFEFRGSRPDQLTEGRFYRGTVDGYAEFGVFVDIGDSVTGLLHRSEIDQRLDSLDWDPGDTVFVEVKNVRDNGNVDLGWSIRQAEREFRGTLVDDPDADHELRREEVRGADSAPENTETEDQTSESAPTPTPSGPSAAGGQGSGAAVASTERQETEGEPTEPSFEQRPIDSLEDHVGDRVRIEGEIAEARQTSGPTIFRVRDETGSVECAAFESAGVRAYPDVDEGDVVRLEGEVERRRGDLQIETEGLVVLEGEERTAISDRMEAAMVEQATPSTVEPLADVDSLTAETESIRDAATAIRRAVFEGRPIVVRHSTTADGYAAAVAIERATLPLIREEHAGADAPYHFFDRRPLEGSVYDLDDATKDVTSMLSNQERHGEQLPLLVFTGVGATTASLDSFELLEIYGARSVVIDHGPVATEIRDAIDVVTSPDDPETTTTPLAATVAAAVNSDVREDLGHLPAVSYWAETPEAYKSLAVEAGYDTETVREIREAVALEAFYHSYEDKRELIIDLLFPHDEGDGDAAGLANHVSQQFRQKMNAELETARANLDTETVDGHEIAVLDTDAYTHHYEFPPTPLLLDALHRHDGPAAGVLVGIGTDQLFVRSTEHVDLTAVAAAAAEAAPSAGIEAASPREGRIEFLAGERDRALAAVLDALAAHLS